MTNIYESNKHTHTVDEIGVLLVSVNATIEKQIEQIKQDVDKFSEFLIELKEKSQTS